MLGAMDLGITDHGERAGGEQAAQIAISLFADAAELVLAPARVLLRHQPDPGREVPSRAENLRPRLRPVPWPAPDQCQEWHPAAGSSHWIDARPGSGGRTPGSAPST